jgi:hypothetical protein
MYIMLQLLGPSFVRHPPSDKLGRSFFFLISDIMEPQLESEDASSGRILCASGYLRFLKLLCCVLWTGRQSLTIGVPETYYQNAYEGVLL